MNLKIIVAFIFKFCDSMGLLHCIALATLLYVSLEQLSCEDTEMNEEDGAATLIFGGDVCLGDMVQYFASRTCDYKQPFNEIIPYWRDADYRIVNSESVLLKNNIEPSNDFLPLKDIRHWSEAKSVEGLRYAGINLVSLGNNHAMDFGEEGVASNLDTLNNAGIEHVGLTDKGKQTQTPVIKTIKGVRIGFLSYCYIGEGCLFGKDLMPIQPAWFNKTIAAQEIGKLRKKVDYIVVMMHWGIEHIPVPPKHVRHVAQELKLYGANLTIGSHPHVPQGYQCLGRSNFVAYSLGNLVFVRTGVTTAEKSGDNFRVSEYAKQMREVYNPTQQSYLLKIKVNRTRIVEASYLQYDIKDEPVTHCLQPTPITGIWNKVCDSADFNCLDFDAMRLADEDAFSEYATKRKYRACVPE